MKKVWMLLIAILFQGFFAHAQNKTITNSNLEKYRQERLKNDPDDERERARLGLPSRAEQELARQKRLEETSEIAEKVRAEQALTENYWNAQAFELRSEIAAVEAEINYVRTQIGEMPRPQTYYAVGYNPYYVNCCYGGVGYTSRRTVTNAQVGIRPPISKGPQFSVGANIGQTEIRQSAISLNAKTRLNFGGIPYQRGILTVPFTLPTAQNLTREELLARLRLLEQTRAGLYSRFAVLEDEAHRNGVKLN